ncbi:sugar 3,4-ketoisomerase [Pseudomonas sp. TCU-HL1]|uniref:sugar 3,4-ketoisomerase n=1 Tax=Pseudomonas sp. TCU-HL1 TaxID=1856685 RepID=UPI00083E0323|nr:FdtA/QdtA family cupin domain-containing protein [Pseudomonas sp. TCU-HL1]AOE87808.1 dTDP-6-deoxy-3,4-keto-hexulose isomerase [Pseudomonas sp. TCU-HL1]
MSLIKLIDFRTFSDPRGTLAVVEASLDVSFEIRRVYYLYGLSGDLHRGFHAHRELEQIAICLSGSCSFLLDDGQRRETLSLGSPHQGLRIERMVWHEMFDFSPDCVLMVLASEHYDESDYIRNYEQFLTEVNHAASP